MLMKGAHENVVAAVGHTPIVRLNRLASHVAANIYVKLEYLNPGGSAKECEWVKGQRFLRTDFRYGLVGIHFLSQRFCTLLLARSLLESGDMYMEQGYVRSFEQIFDFIASADVA